MPWTVYVLFENNIQTTIADVTAEASEDVVNFDNSNYRDLAELPMQGIFDNNASGGANTVSAVQIGAHQFGIATLEADPDAPILPYQPDLTGTTHSVIGDDMARHIPPRNESKKRTRYKWTTSGGGVYWAWADEILGTSSSQFTFVN